MNNQHDVNLDADAGAAAAAEWLAIGDSLFKNLSPGDHFRFKGDSLVQVKLARNAYRAAADKSATRFQTSQRSAVFRVVRA